MLLYVFDITLQTISNKESHTFDPENDLRFWCFVRMTNRHRTKTRVGDEHQILLECARNARHRLRRSVEVHG
jgi:hypothetical protein